MLNSTLDALKAVLRTDETVTPRDRARVLSLVRHAPGAHKPESTAERVERLIRRREAAARLSCSVRTVDKLAASGVLLKRKLPGRVRSSGFLESDLVGLLTQKEAE